MEIAGIDTIQTLKTVGSKERLQPVQIEDAVTISSEGKKKSEWVELLKEMPDIRPEKIEMAVKQTTISSAELATHLMNSLF